MGGSLLIVSWLTVMHSAYTAGAESWPRLIGGAGPLRQRARPNPSWVNCGSAAFGSPSTSSGPVTRRCPTCINLSSPRVESLVRAAVNMGRELGLTTVAEGVRDAGTAARLLKRGFDVAQGDFFGAPIPAASVPGLTTAMPAHLGVAR